MLSRFILQALLYVRDRLKKDFKRLLTLAEGTVSQRTIQSLLE